MVDRVAGNAAREPPGFLDQVQRAVFHGSLVVLKGSQTVELLAASPSFDG